MSNLRDLSDFDNDFILSNPYKEFSFTLADGATETIYYNFSFFQILEMSVSSGVRVIFGGAGGIGSDIIGAGVGYELPTNKITNRVDIVNESGGSIAARIGLAIGKINDMRFTTSGLVSVTDQPSALISVADNALSTTREIVLAANTNRAQAFITNIDSSIAMRYGDIAITTTRGARLLAGQTLILNTTAVIYMIAESGTPSIATSYTEYA